MKLQPSDLTLNGFVLLDMLPHKELVPFVQTYIKKRTFFSALYYLVNLAAIGLAFYLFLRKDSVATGDRVVHFSYGLALAFLLMPLHEYLHALAYKAMGAAQTSFDANLKKFYFMALAHEFVASRREFYWVALTPFAVISLGLLLALPLVSLSWTLTLAGMLLAHTAMCSGDFGLLSYFAFHSDKEVVTYDDKESGVSYFFSKNK